MKAIRKIKDGIAFKENCAMPELTETHNVLIKVYYAGICRTDIGIAKGTITAKDNIILGHELCGEIVGFYKDKNTTEYFGIGSAVSVNPMMFGDTPDIMCGKDCDGAFAEYIAAPSKALVSIAPHLLSPLGAYLEPVAASLAPLKYLEHQQYDRICVYGNNRIAELTCQVLRTMGIKDIEHICNLQQLVPNSYDIIIETAPQYIDAHINALKYNGTLILKSRSYTPSSVTTNNIAMKEIRVQGARYGDFNVASCILSDTSANQTDIDIKRLFGNIYRLNEYEKALEEAEIESSKKVFFKICAE